LFNTNSKKFKSKRPIIINGFLKSWLAEENLIALLRSIKSIFMKVQFENKESFWGWRKSPTRMVKEKSHQNFEAKKFHSMKKRRTKTKSFTCSKAQGKNNNFWGQRKWLPNIQISTKQNMDFPARSTHQELEKCSETIIFPNRDKIKDNPKIRMSLTAIKTKGQNSMSR